MNSHAAQAISLLVGFHRRRKKMSQVELAHKGGVSPGSIAMIESGKRIPNGDTLQKIATALDLSRYEAVVLQASAGYTSTGMLPSVASFVPQDVANGMPIFLRTLEEERLLQKSLNLKEVWVCALDGALGLEEADPLYRLMSWWTEQDVKVTLFLNRSDRFSFWNRRITEESQVAREMRTFRLKQLSLNACLGSFILFDPGFTTPMFGRSIFCCRSFPVGTLPMDRPEVERAWEILQNVAPEA